MTERKQDPNKNISPKDAASILGAISARLGRRPDEEMVRMVKENPELLEGFMDGAVRGQTKRPGR